MVAVCEVAIRYDVRMQHKKHLFFDMDQTIAPARQAVLPEMKELLNELPHDVIVVSGSTVEQMRSQTDGISIFKLGQCGNHAFDREDNELWREALTSKQQNEILEHIHALIAELDHELNHDWDPIEVRGAQITFSPIGNTAPVEHKKTYDPDRKKRMALMEKVPFVSDELVVKIGGSTSLDYLHKDLHKGSNVARIIETQGWQKDDCVYFGDGLYPGGNDEAVIGVIETVPVQDHHDTYEKLREYFKV